VGPPPSTVKGAKPVPVTLIASFPKPAATTKASTLAPVREITFRALTATVGVAPRFTAITSAGTGAVHRHRIAVAGGSLVDG